MKHFARLVGLSFLTFSAHAADIRAWSLPSVAGIESPESALYDGVTKSIYVSNIGPGGALGKDGKGWILKLDPQGGSAAKLVDGLNAPKGMGVYKGVLWVTDIDQILSFDIKTGKALTKIDVPGAKFLNDISIDSGGHIYISDSLASKIYTLQNGQLATFAEGPELESPNGLLIERDRLVVAAWGLTDDMSKPSQGHLYTLSLKTKKKTLWPKLSQPLGNLDGLIRDKRGDYIVSDWVAGKVYRVTPRGDLKVIFAGPQGSADIGYIPDQDLLLIPQMGQSTLEALHLGALLRVAK